MLLTTLYDYTKARYFDENHPELDKETVHRQFYPDRPFRDKEKSPLDSLASDLFRLVRLFLVQKDFEQEQNAATELLPLMRFYRKHSLEERFWQTVETTQKVQDKNQLRSAQYFFNQFKIEEEISNFQGLFNTHEDDANLNKAQLNLDIFFSIIKLEYICAFNHQFRLSQIESTLSPILSAAVIDFTEKDDIISIPIIRIYRTILDLTLNPIDEEKIKKLEDLLSQYKTLIPRDKFQDFQAYYRSYWARQYVKSGSTFVLQKMFSILEEHLIEGYFYIDSKVPVLAFRLLTNFGLKLGKFEWVKKLLDDHPPERICGTKYPVEAHNLNVAEYHFHKKEYAEAEAKLTYRLFENPNFSIMADVLLIKIYYEAGSELLDSRMKALEQKVRRTKISAETKAGYYNFLKKLDKVIKYGWQKKSPRRAKLIEEVRTTPGVFAREWLLEKLEAGAE